MFKENGYNDRASVLSVHLRGKTHLREILTSVASLSLPISEPTSSCISRVLCKHDIQTVCLLPRKVTCFLWTVKDDLGLKTLGVYSITCKCEKVYMGQTRLQDQTAPLEHPALSSGEISHSSSQCKHGSPHPVSWHQYPDHEIQMHGTYNLDEQ